MADTPLRTLARWTQRMARARRLRADWQARFQVDALARTFAGDPRTTGWRDPQTEVRINRFWPTIKALMPGLVAKYPKFFVRPSGKQAGQVAFQQAAAEEALLEHLMRQDDHFVQQAKLALQQTFWGIGVLKVIYDPRLERNPQAGEPLYVTDAAGQPVHDPQTGQPQPLRDVRTGAPLTEPRRILRDEVYNWRWIPYGNMLLPDEGPDHLRWTWIGEEVTVALEEAQDDERFPESLRDQLRPSRLPRGDGLERPDQVPAAEDLDPQVSYVECWDIRSKRLVVVAEGQAFSATRVLLDDDFPEGVEDHPYALHLGYTPETDPAPQAWPIPLVWNWLGLHEEYQIRRQQGMNAAQRSARKIYYDESTFADSDEAVNQLQSSRDMEGVKLQDVGRPPVTLPDPGPPPNITQDLALLDKDWRDVTGLPGERLGTPTADTATQAVLSNQSANMRESEMRQVVDLWLTAAGKKMLQRLKATLTLDVAVKIRQMSDQEYQAAVQRFLPSLSPEEQLLVRENPDIKHALMQKYGQEQWLEVTREMLQFEADVWVQPGSARARNLELDRQATLQFMQLIAQAPLLTLSRPLMQHLGDLFDLGNAPLIESLQALGQQALQAQQRPQPGQGGGPPQGAAPGAGAPGPVGNGSAPMQRRLMTAMLQGGRP